MEYMPGGDLKSYLQNSRKALQQSYANKVSTHCLTQKNILRFALDVGKGMVHLASKQVHISVLLVP